MNETLEKKYNTLREKVLLAFMQACDTVDKALLHEIPMVSEMGVASQAVIDEIGGAYERDDVVDDYITRDLLRVNGYDVFKTLIDADPVNAEGRVEDANKVVQGYSDIMTGMSRERTSTEIKFEGIVDPDTLDLLHRLDQADKVINGIRRAQRTLGLG